VNKSLLLIEDYGIVVDLHFNTVKLVMICKLYDRWVLKTTDLNSHVHGAFVLTMPST